MNGYTWVKMTGRTCWYIVHSSSIAVFSDYSRRARDPSRVPSFSAFDPRIHRSDPIGARDGRAAQMTIVRNDVCFRVIGRKKGRQMERGAGGRREEEGRKKRGRKEEERRRRLKRVAISRANDVPRCSIGEQDGGGKGRGSFGGNRLAGGAIFQRQKAPGSRRTLDGRSAGKGVRQRESGDIRDLSRRASIIGTQYRRAK